ncbi:SRPBCC family protein [Streptomyces palmae]|uniref:SRPBCC family protein n=1 Tax=Streptomyces palmae TaxID=1701085 RepID=A0A4Z0FX70_9ACTN|nr:SRPBCC family protein [Streptomyces palmae]TGA86973.1 SRPBCC family protein [Streptomyces palmae]
MTAFRTEHRCPLPPAEAWRRVTDWPRHGAWVPLTRIAAEPPGPTAPGTLVVARTGLGRLAFDDPMEVVRWTPPAPDRPGHCRLVKRGTRVIGWAEIEVRAVPGGSLVSWQEDARVRGLPRLFDAPTAWAGRLVFGRVVRHLLATPAHPR